MANIFLCLSLLQIQYKLGSNSNTFI